MLCNDFGIIKVWHGSSAWTIYVAKNFIASDGVQVGRDWESREGNQNVDRAQAKVSFGNSRFSFRLWANHEGNSRSLSWKLLSTRVRKSIDNGKWWRSLFDPPKRRWSGARRWHPRSKKEVSMQGVLVSRWILYSSMIM